MICYSTFLMVNNFFTYNTDYMQKYKIALYDRINGLFKVIK